MSIAVGIQETATPGADVTFSLTASADQGVLRVSDRFGVGQAVQLVIKSQDSDKYEEGFYVAAAENQVTRSHIVNGSSGAGVAVDFLAETVDVRVTPVKGGIDQMLPNISEVSPVKALFSDHLHDGGANQTQLLLQDRITAVPFIQRYSGEIIGLRDEFTAEAGATYRWSIRTVDPTTGDPGVELWQSGDLTTALAMTTNTVSPGLVNNGEPLWLLVMHTHTSNPTIRAGNRSYAGPSQAGVDSGSMRNITSIWADITPSSNIIPASITWGGDSVGNSAMPALVYA